MANLYEQDFCGDYIRNDGREDIKQCTDLHVKKAEFIKDFNTQCKGQKKCSFNPIKNYVVKEGHKNHLVNKIKGTPLPVETKFDCIQEESKIYF